MKVYRIENSESFREVLSDSPTKLLLDHESIETNDLRPILSDVGIEGAIVWE